jgi:hypothetical protein
MILATTGCGRTVPGTGAAAGAPVRDGALEFAVRDVSQTSTVGDVQTPGLSIEARGVYVVAAVSVRNTGDRWHTFVDRYQTLLDSTGGGFAVSTAANIYGNLDVPSTRLEPGQRIEVDLAFDVPVGTVPVALVLRESASSEGVRVRLP